MGHTRLGVIPKSRSWTAVVDAVVGPGVSFSETDVALTPVSSTHAIARVAAQTLEAAAAGLALAKRDDGLKYSYFLLTQIALASRQKKWAERLSDLGISLQADSSIFDLASQAQGAIDAHLLRRGSASDLSEMAQKALGEAICGLAGPASETLFGNSGEELRVAVRQLSGKAGFGQLAQAFFGRFMAGFLNFYLSRVTASKMGSGSLLQVGDLTALNRALLAHCHESAAIVRDFAAQWYSKTEYQHRITSANAGRFVAVAIDKLEAELRAQRANT